MLCCFGGSSWPVLASPWQGLLGACIPKQSQTPSPKRAPPPLSPPNLSRVSPGSGQGLLYLRPAPGKRLGVGRDTFWDPLKPPSPSHFLQERDRGSQDHFARRYLQICGANNHPHPPFNSLSPSWAALRKALERYPLKNPAPRCPPDSHLAPPPGSAHPSPGRLAVFPEQNRQRGLEVVSHLSFRPPLREPTSRSRARGHEAGRAAPKSALTPSPAPFPSLHLRPFFQLQSLRLLRLQSPASLRLRGNFFLG